MSRKPPRVALGAALAARRWWMKGDPTSRKETWFRWTGGKQWETVGGPLGGIRQEIVLIFDAAGRLESWSYWENRRVSIDGDTGRRERLEQFIVQHGSS